MTGRDPDSTAVDASVERFVARHPEVRAAPRWLVALSGGLDSMLLTRLLAAMDDARPKQLTALHVDHGLHPDSGRWLEFCHGACRSLEIGFEGRRLSLPVDGSPEDRARRARYDWFRSALGDGEVLFLAHHRDDQAETVLLNLVRGGGLRGLAAMPGLRRFGRGWLARPLLDLDRADLEARARTLDFPWLADPANESPEPDRNHLRHEVLPLLRRRWPAATRAIARAAANLADELAVLEWLGGADLADCRSPSAAVLPVLGCLSRAAVVATGERRRNLLRHWFRSLGVRSPSAARLGEIERQFLDREPAVTAVVRWDRVEMRSYRGRIYLVPEREPLTGTVDWCLDEPLELARPGIRLRALRTTAGVRIGAGLNRLQVARRRGGERCRPAGRGHSQTLGRLFQESGVAPWERDLVPLLWCADGLVFVPGPGPCEPFAARGDEPGFAIRIESLTGP